MPTDLEPPNPAWNLARTALLDYLPKDAILARYENAGGKEVSSGKFAHPESSAALVANAFGLFMAAPQWLSIPRALPQGSAKHVMLEAEMRFPWNGGRHPWLDVGIETDTHILGIESKRYEPFRDNKKPTFSRAYIQTDWGPAMTGFERMRDDLTSNHIEFAQLDAAQLVKHAFGLRTQASSRRKKATLIYLYAEPKAFSGGLAISMESVLRHRREVQIFAEAVASPDCEVAFITLRYDDLLADWLRHTNDTVRVHAGVLKGRFDL